MGKIRAKIQQYFLKRALKKRVAALKSFRHTDADILPQMAHDEVDALLEKAQTIAAMPDKEACKEWADSAGEVIHKYTRFGTMREILDILAVALMVAFGIRALFFQPFKSLARFPILFTFHFNIIFHRADGQREIILFFLFGVF